ncbi:MAG: hypothetical protein ACW99U_16800 [Candidatus Thorarchaeota archaeon]
MPNERNIPEYDDLLGSPLAPKLRMAYEEAFPEALKAQTVAHAEAYENSKAHDDQVMVSISAFAPDGRLAKKTGYQFFSSEPLVEIHGLQCKTFDFIVANRKQGVGILVECKAGLAHPAKEIKSIYEAIEQVEERQDYLSKRLGAALNNLEFVLCIPSEHLNNTARTLNELEATGEIDLRTQHALKLWHVNRFQRHNLGLFTQLKREEEHLSQHLDADLTSTLSDGYQVGDEIWVACFPNSHHLVKIDAALVRLHQIHPETLTSTTVEELSEIYSDFSILPHYDIRNIGPHITKQLVTMLEQLEIANCEDNRIQLRIKGKRIKTVMRRLRDIYIEKRAKIAAIMIAKESAVREVLARYRSLDDLPG